jgi:hypothetical protein
VQPGLQRRYGDEGEQFWNTKACGLSLNDPGPLAAATPLRTAIELLALWIAA